MIRILIVDDHQLLRDGLRQMLTEEMDIEVVGDAANGKEAIEWLNIHEADVVLMDVNMPEMDGVEATARIMTAFPDCKILALTMLDQGSFVQLMLRNGAMGYLLKDTTKKELLEAIHTIYKGDKYLGQKATDLLVRNISKPQRGSNTFLPKITRREKEVLQFISQGKSDVEIAALLHVSASTIESHRKNLRSKLGAKNSAEIVRVAMERGLM